jgi:glycosyltransferase involved in cell wall biosynthesis
MARLRLEQHSRLVRTNVDVLIEDANSRRRWLTATPDTYRVRSSREFGSTPTFHRIEIPVPPDHDVEPGDIIVVAPTTLDGVTAAAAAHPLADQHIDACAIGPTTQPGLIARRRVEPKVLPVAVAIRGDAWIEVGGAPGGEAPLLGLWERLRATGRHLALVPGPVLGESPQRTDHIIGPAVVIMALVPMHDIGGGSRGAQMGIELLRRGYHVVYVSLYGSDESVDLGQRIIHPHLEQRTVSDFDATALNRRLDDSDRTLIVQAPARLVLGPAHTLQDAGFRVVYDLIDDWSAPSLGGEWFRDDVERRFIEMADRCSASSPDLVTRLDEQRARTLLIPNAVNSEVFGRRPGSPPSDFPTGDGPVLGYHGSLYGDWFDWEALAACAATPGSRVVVLGDVPDDHPPMPSNVIFLGLKAHEQLPGYVSRFDVGLIPFRVNDATHAVSPLKAYEYLACGVPVAAPRLRSLEGLEGVFVADDLVAAVEAARAGEPPEGAAALAAHSWGARLESLWSDLGKRLKPVRDPGASILWRPPIHYPSGERSL